MTDYNPLDHLDNIVNNSVGRRDAKYMHSCAVWPDGQVWGVANPIKLENGGKLSVQATHTHYCEPRNSTGPWTAVEVGFPEGVYLPDSWKPFADYPKAGGWRSSDVFGWVPVELVRDLILQYCPKLRAELEAKDKELSKDTPERDANADERREWFNKVMR